MAESITLGTVLNIASTSSSVTNAQTQSIGQFTWTMPSAATQSAIVDMETAGTYTLNDFPDVDLNGATMYAQNNVALDIDYVDFLAVWVGPKTEGVAITAGHVVDVNVAIPAGTGSVNLMEFAEVKAESFFQMGQSILHNPATTTISVTITAAGTNTIKATLIICGH